MNIPLFNINAGESLELNFDLYAMISPGQWQNQYNNTVSYVLDDVIVQGNVIAQQRGATVAALREVATTQNIAYQNILASLGNPPPNATYWTALTAIAAADIKSAFLELISAGQTRVSWQYQWTGDPIAQPPVLINDLLTVGVTYQIINFVAGDDFTNVGADSNATGVIFTATGTTPTTWSNGSGLQQAVLIIGRNYLIQHFLAGDDFSNIGAGSDATGVIFTATGVFPTTWTNDSVLQEVTYPSNLVLADGLLKCELLAGDSAVRPAGLYELRLSLGTANTEFVGSGAQTDVTSFQNIIGITIV